MTLGDNGWRGLALINLADTLLQPGRSSEAATYLERARVLLSTLDRPNPYNSARTDLSLARAYLHAGDHDIADTGDRRACDDDPARL